MSCKAFAGGAGSEVETFQPTLVTAITKQDPLSNDCYGWKDRFSSKLEQLEGLLTCVPHQAYLEPRVWFEPLDQ